MMDIFTNQDVIPLSYSRSVNNSLVSGLTVTVVVKNASTGATLLSSTSCPEVSVGSGIYTFNWTHGLKASTECIVTFTAGSVTATQYMLIQITSGGRTA